MNVTMVVAELGIGGAEAVVSELARYVTTDGGFVTLASSGGWRSAEVLAAGVPIVSIPLRGRRPIDLARSAAILRRELRRNKPDVIHSHNVKAASVARIACFGVRDRPAHLATLHGLPASRYSAGAHILARSVDALVAVSDDVAARIVSAGYPSGQVTVVPNAVPRMPTHDRTEARLRLGVSPASTVVVCIARLVDQKRHDLLIEAWRAMPEDWMLLLAGDGHRRAAVEQAAADAGLFGRIRLLGDRTDVDWLLAAADLSVLPTDWEGLPVTVLEAMSAGVPVVVSDVSGMADSLRGGAHLVVPGSSDALAAAMLQVAGDEAHRRELVAAGTRLVRSRYSSAGMLRAYREVYERVASMRRVEL